MTPRPVRQTRFGFPRGNCLEAAYATLLGVPVEAVPDPRQACPAGARRCAARALPDRPPTIRRWLWESFGLAVVEGPGLPKVRPRPGRPLYWLAAGPGPRGLNHAVVGVTWTDPAGRTHHDLAWDPYPTDEGLLSVSHHRVLVPA